MVQTQAPLREKMCLFWHRVFATAASKLIQAAHGGEPRLDMFPRATAWGASRTCSCACRETPPC